MPGMQPAVMPLCLYLFLGAGAASVKDEGRERAGQWQTTSSRSSRKSFPLRSSLAASVYYPANPQSAARARRLEVAVQGRDTRLPSYSRQALLMSP